MGLDGGGKRLAGGSGKLEKGTEELGMSDKYPGLGGGQTEFIWNVLQGGCAGSVAFRIGDVGPDPPHIMVPGKFSAQVRTADHRDIAQATGGGGVGLSTSGFSYGGGGIQ